MFPVFQIGPLSLQAPGLILLIGLWLGLIIAERLAPNFKANPNHIYNLVFVTLGTGILGARLSYVLENLEVFLHSPLNLFSLNPGLLDPIGGIAVGLVVAIIYVNRKQIPLWTTLDALTPFLAVVWIAWGLSNLASGKAFGSETLLPWGIDLWGATRHPTQVYQILAGLFTLMIIWPGRSPAKSACHVPGETIWLFSAWSSAAWMLVEALRGDSILLPGGVRAAQVVAWLVLAVSLWRLGKIKQATPHVAEDL
jgi:phosphatidylglycerol:prolipoprotein diacylglycerol transferase